MHAMILAAGRGERMRPLTDAMPKPLIPVAGKPLIFWHLERLARAGFVQVVINHAWLGTMLEAAIGDGSAFGLEIVYSAETTALETAGGIATAMPWLGTHPFLVINGDVWCDWDPGQALSIAEQLNNQTQQAWLLLVPNPSHHPEGDFALMPDNLVQPASGKTDPIDTNCYTFSGIGIYDPLLFAQTPAGHPAKLAPLLRAAMVHGQVSGALHAGMWVDVGTPERLARLEQCISTLCSKPE